MGTKWVLSWGGADWLSQFWDPFLSPWSAEMLSPEAVKLVALFTWIVSAILIGGYLFMALMLG